MKPSAEAIGAIKLYLARNSFFEIGGGWKVANGYGSAHAARVHRLHLRAVDRRPRRRRLQGRRRPVPGRSGGLRRLRGRRRLPGARQRQGRHPRRRRQVPERSRDQERLSGRRRLPRQHDLRSRRRPHPRRRRQVPRRSGGLRQLRGRGRLPRSGQRQGRHQRRRPTSARTIPRTRTASRTPTVAPIRTTTTTASWTRSDKCPNEPENYNGFKDDDGCPDKGMVEMTQGQDRDPRQDLLRDRQGRDQARVSFPLLDAVAAVINGNPQIQLIEIQGHADERGDDAHNLDLTERRAASVRRALERAQRAPEPAQEPRLRRDQADLQPAQRRLLEQEPARRVHHPEAQRRSEAPGRRRPVGTSSPRVTDWARSRARVTRAASRRAHPRELTGGARVRRAGAGRATAAARGMVVAAPRPGQRPLLVVAAPYRVV